MISKLPLALLSTPPMGVSPSLASSVSGNVMLKTISTGLIDIEHSGRPEVGIKRYVCCWKLLEAAYAECVGTSGIRAGLDGSLMSYCLITATSDRLTSNRPVFTRDNVRDNVRPGLVLSQLCNAPQVVAAKKLYGRL
jgi:hypothetical protein